MKTTLCFLMKENKILLAMKKRSFGEGKWNGVGGKVVGKESVKEAAIREIEEEIDVVVSKNQLKPVALIDFAFVEKPEWNQRCAVYVAKKWEGKPKETEEMRPKWFSFKKLPFNKMWIDDVHWVPHILKGKKITAKFYFGNLGKEIVKWQLKRVSSLPKNLN